MTGRKGRELLEFEILWYSGGPDHAPNRVIGRTRVKRYDLTDAITAACNLMKRNHEPLANGFYVRKVSS